MMKIHRSVLKILRNLEHGYNYNNLHKIKINRNYTQNNTNDKILPIKSNESSHDHKTNICIIGGGMAPIFCIACLKQFAFIKSIHLVDPKDTTANIVSDVNHIDTSPRVKYFQKSNVQQAVQGVRTFQNYSLYNSSHNPIFPYIINDIC